MLSAKIRHHLEQALLEALKNHIAKKKTAVRRKKKTGKEKPLRRPAKKRARKTAPRKKARRKTRA